MVRRTTPDNDWNLGIDEIRRLNPQWSEAMVLDYFNKGSRGGPTGGGGEANTTSNEGGGAGLALPKSGVNLPFKSLLAGDNIVLTEQDFTVTIDASGEAGDCYCFNVPSQDCETIEPDCEAITQFFQTYGGPGAYYLSRNFEADLIGGVSGEVQSIYGPNGDIELALAGPGSAVDLDTCGENILSFSGGGSSTTTLTLRDLGNVNSMAMGFVFNGPLAYPEGGKNIWGGRSGSDTSIGYQVGWNPTTRQLSIVDGDKGTLDPDRYVEFSIDGPSGYDPDLNPVWVVLFVKVTRSSSTLSMSASWVDAFGGGSSSGSQSTSEAGNPLSTRTWWTTANGGDNSFTWGGTSTADALAGRFLYTGLYAAIPSMDYLRRLFYEVRRNTTTFDCEVDGPPPIVSGSVPRYDEDTDSWELEPPLPPVSEDGLYLVSSATGPQYAQWQALPITGGTTGQQLTKVSDAQYDVAWTQRDVRAFDQLADPALTETVLTGDLWIQGGIG